MAFISADRVRDTSTSTGTGTFVVTGTAPTGGYRTFSAVATTNDTFYYCIQGQGTSEWEVGLGTYSALNTITRTTVYASSNSGSAVSFSSGTKDVFITLAATRTPQFDNTNNIDLGMFFCNATTLSVDHTLLSSRNVISAGPTISIASGATLTVPSDTTWTVI